MTDVVIHERYVMEDGELWPADPATRAAWKAVWTHSPMVLLDASLIDSITVTRLMTREEFDLRYPRESKP